MGVALVAWWLESGVGWPVDANVIGVVILLNAVLGWAGLGWTKQGSPSYGCFNPQKGRTAGPQLHPLWSQTE